jgi:hypothetical protein
MTLYHYTYYSYEEFGRGYIGKRSCKCSPEEDVKYFGSYTDKTFKPTQKIILETYDTAEEAIADEVKLHEFYDVANNLHFANKAKQKTEKFTVPPNEIKKYASMGGKIGGLRCKELNLGVCGQTKEERIKYATLGGYKTGKEVGQKNKELKRGFLGMSNEQLREGRGIGRKKVCEDNVKFKRGWFALTDEQKSEVGRKTCAQKWQCTETGFITNAGNLSKYQRARGIDTSNRIRIS